MYGVKTGLNVKHQVYGDGVVQMPVGSCHCLVLFGRLPRTVQISDLTICKRA
jgi:hypothetical protein